MSNQKKEQKKTIRYMYVGIKLKKMSEEHLDRLHIMTEKKNTDITAAVRKEKQTRKMWICLRCSTVSYRQV